MTSQRTGLLGLFFLIALGVLGYYTLFLTDFTMFGRKAQLVVYFSETNGLREGDSVLVAGMRWGKVKSLAYRPEVSNEERIRVVVTLDEQLALREGFTITIQDATLLGGKNLAIDPGPPDGAVVPPDRILYGQVGRNPLTALGDLVSESQKGLTTILEDIAAIASGVREGRGPLGRIVADEQLAKDLTDTMHSAAITLANLERVSGDLAQGRGTAGRLLTSPDLYDELLAATRKLNTMLTETTAMVGDFREGEGLLPRLFEDRELAGQVASTVARIDRIVAGIERGEGTVGALLTDDTIAKNVTSITGKIDRGEGALGAFLTNPEIYDNLRDTSENLAVMTTAMRNGQGSLGHLIMDDEIYQQIKTALLIVQRALEEYREAAPVTTFTSVFFGAF